MWKYPWTFLVEDSNKLNNLKTVSCLYNWPYQKFIDTDFSSLTCPQTSIRGQRLEICDKNHLSNNHLSSKPGWLAGLYAPNERVLDNLDSLYDSIEQIYLVTRSEGARSSVLNIYDKVMTEWLMTYDWNVRWCIPFNSTFQLIIYWDSR